ncbi:hypothetical protein [Micromonospora palomenae]|uniref:hypothetical protein n=1 Tax=Micromonospora palomenae TaxID=1461247 RepID=UPI003F8B3C03
MDGPSAGEIPGLRASANKTAVEQLPGSEPQAGRSAGVTPGNGATVPTLKLWDIGKAIGLLVAVAGVIVAALLLLAFWYAGFPSLQKDGTVSARTLFDLLKLVFAVVAGIGGVAALVVAYRKQKVAEHANRLSELAHELARVADLRAEAAEVFAKAADERAKIETERNGVRLLNERFAKAAEQMGSEKAAVRLAGTYAMAGLADDWKDGRATCIDVLCAYLRMPYADRDTPGSAIRVELMEEQQVRRTIIRLIGARLRLDDSDPRSWSGYDLDFTGAVLDGGELHGARFTGGSISFDHCTFASRVFDLSDAVFSGANVSFRAATFKGGEVSFHGTALTGGELNFSDSTFEGAEVSFALASFELGSCHFDWAIFAKGTVFFADTTFGGTNVFFSGVTFDGGQVVFDGARLVGGNVFFSGVKLDGGALSFDGASFSGARVLFSRGKMTSGEVTFKRSVFEVPPLFESWPDAASPRQPSESS